MKKLSCIITLLAAVALSCAGARHPWQSARSDTEAFRLAALELGPAAVAQYKIPISSVASAAQGGVAYDNGTSGAWLSPTTSGEVLTTQGSSANPAWEAIASLLTQGTGVTITGTTNATISLTTPVSIAHGGTGASTASANTFFSGPLSGSPAAPSFRAMAIADLPGFYSNDINSNQVEGAVAVVDSTNYLSLLPPATAGLVLTTQGTGQPAEWSAVVSNIVGTTNEVNVSNAGSVFTLSAPQPIATTSDVTFDSLTVANPVTVANGGTGLASTSQYYGFRGPTGGSGAPTWRADVLGDLPAFYSGIGSPSQGAVPYVNSSGNLTSLTAGTSGYPLLSGGSSANPSFALLGIGAISATGTPSSTTYLRGDGTWSTPSGSSGVTSIAGTANQVTASASTGSVTLSLPSTVDITGLNLSGLTASDPIVTDSSKNLASLSYASFAGNLPFSDLSGVSITSGAQGDILYNNGTNYVNLPHGTSGQFLKTQGASANPVWATATAGAAGSSTDVQFNSSGSFAGDAGMTYLGAATTGNLLSLSPTGSGATALQITPTSTTDTLIAGAMPASFAGNLFTFKDSSAAINAQIFQSTTQTGMYLLNPTSGQSQAVMRMGLNSYEGTSGNGLAAIQFGESITGTFGTLASIQGIAEQIHSSGAQGTGLYFSVTPSGSATAVSQYAMMANGNFVANHSGTAPATTATNGFMYIPSCAGIPTGTPAYTVTGAMPHIMDSTDNVFFMYNSNSVWQPMGNNPTVAVSTPGQTISVPSDVYIASGSVSGGTITIPAASNYPGCRMAVKWLVHSATYSVALTPASGNIEGASSYTFSAGSATFPGIILESLNGGWWIVSSTTL